MLNHSIFEMITPSDPEERGSHLSIKFKTNIQSVFEELEKNGIVVSIKYLSLKNGINITYFCYVFGKSVIFVTQMY